MVSVGGTSYSSMPPLLTIISSCRHRKLKMAYGVVGLGPRRRQCHARICQVLKVSHVTLAAQVLSRCHHPKGGVFYAASCVGTGNVGFTETTSVCLH